MPPSRHPHSAPVPLGEATRLRILREYAVLDTAAEQAFDDIVRLASRVCGTQIALVSLVDSYRQWFKARTGLDAAETPREYAFCAHAILRPDDVLVVPDAALDERFATNPLVTGEPRIRFYAGVPLVAPTGEALGTLCVIDRRPRDLDDSQRDLLRLLARQVMAQLEMRRGLLNLERSVNEQSRYLEQVQRYREDLEAHPLAASTEAQDRLTQLPTRESFERRLAEEVERSRRSGVALSLVLVDVDAFRAFNDLHGHADGDTALRQVAQILRSNCRPYDGVARVGGQLFALLLPGSTREGALIAAERVRLAIQRNAWSRRPLTLSAGVATHAGGEQGGAALMSLAERALFQAKTAGRNRVAFAG
jgi:diguanylate cyclase (GGDEF)-like protein